MADLTPKPINELPTASSWSDSDVFPMSASGSSAKTTWGSMKSAILSDILHYETVTGTTDASGNIVLADDWTHRCIVMATSSYPLSIPTLGTSSDGHRFVHVSDYTAENAITNTALIIGLHYLA